MIMDRHQAEALDRHITGNYGEDQFREYDEGTAECQRSGCHNDAEDGVLCGAHQQPAEDACQGCGHVGPDVQWKGVSAADRLSVLLCAACRGVH